MIRARLAFALKLIVAHAMYYTGALHLWQNIAMRRKAIVLMYHRVLTPEERMRTASHPALCVDRDSFACQMQFLRRRFRVLSVNEFARHIEKRIPFPNRSCLITFDDGWRDNYQNALPVLEAWRLPSLVFLPVNYIGGRRMFWQEALTHLLVLVPAKVRRHPELRGRLEPILKPRGLEFVLAALESDIRPRIHNAIGNQKSVSRAEVERLVCELSGALQVRLDELSTVDGFIDWAQARAMADRGVSFGGHGAEHLLLTRVSADEVVAEATQSREALERSFADTVPTFSYPNGYVNHGVTEQVRAAGFRLGFITRRGFVSCTDNPMTISRLNVHELAMPNIPMFMARIVGLW